MYFTNETEARDYAAKSNCYLWPFAAAGQACFQAVSTVEAIDLMGGYDGRYNRAVAEWAVMGPHDITHDGLPVLRGHTVADMLRAAAEEIASEPTEGTAEGTAEPTETASSFLARVKDLTGAAFDCWPHYTDAERIWDGAKLCRRGNVYIITMIDADGVNHAQLGHSGVFAVETEPGAIKALMWEAEVIEPAVARTEALGVAIKALGADATPDAVMGLWRSAGGLGVAGALTGRQDVGGPANGGRWLCPKVPIIVAGWNIGPRGGDIHSPPALTARPAKDGESDNAMALATARLTSITRDAAIKLTSAKLASFRAAVEADAARAKLDAARAEAQKLANREAQRQAVACKSGRTGRARARAVRKA